MKASAGLLGSEVLCVFTCSAFGTVPVLLQLHIRPQRHGSPRARSTCSGISASRKCTLARLRTQAKSQHAPRVGTSVEYKRSKPDSHSRRAPHPTAEKRSSHALKRTDRSSRFLFNSGDTQNTGDKEKKSSLTSLFLIVPNPSIAINRRSLRQWKSIPKPRLFIEPQLQANYKCQLRAL
ncbi:hypothetical protein WMY93_032729 [Mugilogobius chulae]|uniref:Secreted protein n=1 Tax=Mugilogobius chulae TaxID=88201 RepID=A0AAW0MIY3_9GOBI